MITTLGKRLKLLRGEVSQEEIAAKSGVSQSNLSKLELDKTLPRVDALIALADYFQVTTDWLLLGRGPGPGEQPLPAAPTASQNSPQTQKIEAIFDPDLKRMIDILKNIMESDNPHLRSWAIIQFENAFKEHCATVEKKQHA